MHTGCTLGQFLHQKLDIPHVDLFLIINYYIHLRPPETNGLRRFKSEKIIHITYNTIRQAPS